MGTYLTQLNAPEPTEEGIAEERSACVVFLAVKRDAAGNVVHRLRYVPCNAHSTCASHHMNINVSNAVECSRTYRGRNC